MKKFELVLTDTKTLFGITLYRIKALRAAEKMGMLPPFSNAAARKSNQIDAPAGYEWEKE